MHEQILAAVRNAMLGLMLEKMDILFNEGIDPRDAVMRNDQAGFFRTQYLNGLCECLRHVGLPCVMDIASRETRRLRVPDLTGHTKAKQVKALALDTLREHLAHLVPKLELNLAFVEKEKPGR